MSTPIRIAVFLTLFATAGAEATPAAELRGRVMNNDGAPLRDAVVFVQELPEGSAPAPPAAPAVMDQVNKQFVPHVLPIAVGTAVSFPNYDQIHHHVYSFSKAKTFEIPLYKGENAAPVIFDHVGVVKLGCNIHDWMAGVILVVPTPYFTTTGEDGRFVLGGVPDGTTGVTVWHEGSRISPLELLQRTRGDKELSFTLKVDAPRPRAPGGGARGYE
jgi:plastocyanin